MIAITIPLVNVFAVATLIWFSGYERDLKKRGLIFIKALIGNPLIIGSFAGAIYARLVGVFPEFIDNTLQLMSMVTLPLALLQSADPCHSWDKEIPAALFAGRLLKLGIVSGCGLSSILPVRARRTAFKTGMIFFCLPASTTIYVLSSQLNSDTELASASIVVSTLLSFASLSVALLL